PPARTPAPGSTPASALGSAPGSSGGAGGYSPAAQGTAPDTPQPVLTPPPPAEGLDLQDPAVIIDLFDRAAQANLDCPLRHGSTVSLPAHAFLLMTGDLHDHGLNFQRLLKLASLHQSPHRHLILHEMIHGPHRLNGRDLSIRSLARAAALKLQYPNQVHFLQSNHELAQFHGEGITKDSVNVVQAFDAGVEFLYAEDAQDVRRSLFKFIRSFLLAVRCPNGLLCSHSLPSPRRLKSFDPKVLDRLPTNEDLALNGSAYLMVWGRSHNQELADTLAKAWGVTHFLMGHQPAEMGYEQEGSNMLVLASDHEHGMALPLELSYTYTIEDIIGQLVPLAGVVL
ncbi:MAG: hypothetical protein IT443_11740, partial [Phycisphaeraceae bacterium]|nr:hypothetical protein [Phycisphaeraceae bacterium]